MQKALKINVNYPITTIGTLTLKGNYARLNPGDAITEELQATSIMVETLNK